MQANPSLRRARHRKKGKKENEKSKFKVERRVEKNTEVLLPHKLTTKAMVSETRLKECLHLGKEIWLPHLQGFICFDKTTLSTHANHIIERERKSSTTFSFVCSIRKKYVPKSLGEKQCPLEIPGAIIIKAHNFAIKKGKKTKAIINHRGLFRKALERAVAKGPRGPSQRAKITRNG